MTNEKYYMAITPTEWSTAKSDRLVVRGQRSTALAGALAMVTLDLTAMPPEDRYALARTFGKWAERVERIALADIEAEAQAPLFE